MLRVSTVTRTIQSHNETPSSHARFRPARLQMKMGVSQIERLIRDMCKSGRSIAIKILTLSQLIALDT